MEKCVYVAFCKLCMICVVIVLQFIRDVFKKYFFSQQNLIKKHMRFHPDLFSYLHRQSSHAVFLTLILKYSLKCLHNTQFIFYSQNESTKISSNSTKASVHEKE
jgi:hypothetical protein